MRALSIRQPYAEEILRGIKRIEYRDHQNGVRVGEKFYIYAAANVPDDADLRGYTRTR
jgi:predicted transcriptional regulator